MKVPGFRFRGILNSVLNEPSFTSTMLHVSDAGGIENMILTNHGFMKGVYTFNGSLTNASIAQKFNLKYKDLNLLMAARF